MPFATYTACALLPFCSFSSALQLLTNDTLGAFDGLNASTLATLDANGTQLMLPPVKCSTPLKISSPFPSCEQANQVFLHWLLTVDDRLTVGQRG